ncbi:MAG: site-2 protease family protein [Methanobacteriota archaeon]|nr:MAG: site-2 protease family protein [Euryarchaeota archaeon]
MAWPELQRTQTGGYRFSRKELSEIGVSVLILTLAFTIFFSGGIDGLATELGRSMFAYLFVISFLAVLTAFFFHEMAHKFLAQRYGCWAEYSYYIIGLLFAIVTSMFRIIFAAPGAVIIGGPITEAENGKISAAGPATNLSIGAIFAVIYFASRPFLIPVFPHGLDLAGIFYLLAWINIVLGGFNLIPFPPLDGSKIYRWNVAVYVLLVLAAVGMFAALYLL